MKTDSVAATALTFPWKILIIAGCTEGLGVLYSSLKEAGAGNCDWTAIHPKDALLLPADGQYTLIFVQEGDAWSGAPSLIPEIRAKYPDVPLIIVSKSSDSDRAEQMLRNGATDAISLEHIRSGVLPFVLRRALGPRFQPGLSNTDAHLFETVLTSAPAIVWGVDKEGMITHLEGKGVDAVGAASISLVGGNAFETCRNYPATIAAVQRVLSGEAFSHSTEYIRFDNRQGVVDTHCLPVRDCEGNVCGAAGVSSVITANIETEQALREIADKRHAEEALTESEQRFERQYRSLPIPTYTWKKAGDDFLLVDFNDAAIKSSPDSLRGMLNTRATEFFQDNPQVVDLLHRCHAEQTSLETELDYVMRITREHRFFLVHSVASPPDLVLVHTVDLTERKRSERIMREANARLEKEVALRTAELRSAKEEYQLLIENQSDIVMKLSRDGRRLYISPNFLALVGKTEEEVLNTNYLPEIHPDDIEHAAQEWAKTFEPPRYRSEIEARTATPRGWRWISWRNRAILNSRGRPTIAITVGRDITRLKQAEEELRQSEARFRSVFEDATVGMIMVGADFSVIEVNPAFHRILGYDIEDMRRIGLPGITYLEDLEHANQLFTELVNGEINHYQAEKRYIRKDGSIMHGSLSVFGIRGSQGELLYTTGIIEDVTLRKEAEERIRRYNEELERLVAERTEQIRKLEQLRVEGEKQAAVGRMAARIAHEINNPLAGVKNSFLLVKRAIPEEHRHYPFVEMIEKELDRIARIVRQMFELYKPELRQPSALEPAKVIREVIDLLEGNARAQGVTMQIEVARATRLVLLHEDSLRQILFNIIQNAIEASPAGGVVRISAVFVGQRLNVSIADQGTGIPEDVRSHIFDPFFTTKSDLASGGLGLGLSTTQGLVQAMGGTLSFDTETGRGTVFQLSLPAKPAHDVP